VAVGKRHYSTPAEDSQNWHFQPADKDQESGNFGKLRLLAAAAESVANRMLPSGHSPEFRCSTAGKGRVHLAAENMQLHSTSPAVGMVLQNLWYCSVI
jgi:hypothetical protein